MMMHSYISQSSKRHKLRQRIKIYGAIFLGIIIVVTMGYVLVYSPVFQIKNITVSGNKYIASDDIIALARPRVVTNRLEEWLGSNNLLVWGGNNINVAETVLATAVIDRQWIHQTIVIEVIERERFAIWCGGGICYWIDQNGVVFEEAPETQGSLILKISEQDALVVLNKPIVEDRFIKNLLGVLNALATLRVPAQKITFDRRLQEIHVETYSGPNFFFSIRFDPALNVASLFSLREKSNLTNMGYIDLRVENRIFYK
ncbi:MAG: hypothetical protein Q8R26_00925 [bacterium]|nr:hypothetical protein [bacterium]